MNEKLITLTVNGETVSVPKGTSILDAAAAAGYEIPTLCYLKDIAPGGKCRMCQVEAVLNGREYLSISCDETVKEGMIIRTDSTRAKKARKLILELLLSRHIHSCFNCDRHSGCMHNLYQFCNYDENCFTCGARDTCKLRKYALEAGIVIPALQNIASDQPVTELAGVQYDPGRCILCRRCIETAKNETGTDALFVDGRGTASRIACADETIAQQYPEMMRKCVENCPTGALKIQE